MLLRAGDQFANKHRGDSEVYSSWKHHLNESAQVVFKLEAIVLSRGLKTVPVLRCQSGGWCRLCTPVQMCAPTV